MTIKEKLKKANKKTKTGIITGALAMAAILAPVKGQTAEAEPLTKDATTLVASQGATRQQMFEAAVRANMPREEIAKYIDFPEFIPVDKNGQLDQKEVDKDLTYMVTNHFDALSRFYCNAHGSYVPKSNLRGGNTGIISEEVEDPGKFYKAVSTFFAEVTGNTKNQPKFLRALTEATKQVARRESYTHIRTLYYSDQRRIKRCPTPMMGWAIIGILYGFLCSLLYFMWSGSDEEIKHLKTLGAASLLAGIALFFGALVGPGAFEKKNPDPAFMLNLMKAGAQRVYDTYVDNTIGFERDRQANNDKEKSVKTFQQLKQKVETLDHVGNKDNQYIVLTPEEKKLLQTLLQDKQTKR